MPEWMKMCDEIGPESVFHVSDPAVGMKGVVVIDATVFGRASGGTRMLPDITTEEISWLARAMTHKFATLDVQQGGAKAGIWADPGIKGEQRDAILRAFGKAVRPLLAEGLIRLGADMGTDAKDVAMIREGAGLPPSRSTALQQEAGEDPIGDQATAYGVVVAAKSACEFAGMELKGATVAIEGFGKVGGCVARFVDEEGAKVVAISTIDGMAYNENGLDVGKLLDARRKLGDRAIQEYEDAKHIEKEAIYFLPVDVLIPGARCHVIDQNNVGRVQAKVISSIANVPITDEAADILFQRGIHFVPDFISNLGWFVPWFVNIIGGTTDDVFKGLRGLMGSLASNILTDSHKEGTSPRSLAVRRNKEKVLRLRAAKEPPVSTEDFFNSYRQRLKI
jgi:glutamate dehydrogenase (NAD(P)+)